MNALRQNTDPAASPKRSTAESEDVETRANREAADRIAKAAVEGFRKLAREKAARKNPGKNPKAA
jgi:hypothetical protein